LLTLLGVPFEVRAPSFEEHPVADQAAADVAAYFSRCKALSTAMDDPEAVVIGSDTVIDLDGAVLGKPRDLEEARLMLRRLAGRDHLVHTAVTLVCAARRIDATEVATARVWMKPFNLGEHERYLATGDSLGKAGAYSIQGPGSMLITGLDGDFSAVVGLPLRLVAKLLSRAGVAVPVDVERLYESASYGNWPRFRGAQASSDAH
jgi:septum formation protein